MAFTVRGVDRFGSGAFGASRGGRKHNGVDLVVTPPGTPWKSLNSGVVTRLGFAYADDLSYRYIEITRDDGLRFRYFYVDPLPSLKAGHRVTRGDVLGITQTLQKRYFGITEHVHFEVKDGKNIYLDPLQFLEA